MLRLLALLLFCPLAWAADQEAATGRFLEETFGRAPHVRALWLTGELRSAARRVLGHDYPSARLRYWQAGGRTAWVLEEIGKELPITVGISVEEGAVRAVRVLAYRESRGWEVQHPAFTAQFDGARLTPQAELDRAIDGISGATLSVRALVRLSRLALLLHGSVSGGGAPR